MAYDWSQSPSQIKPAAGTQAPASPAYTFGTTADKTNNRSNFVNGTTPQKVQGTGISFRGNPAPYSGGGNPSSNPATQKPAYNPTTAPFGFDQTQPGVGQQYWNNNQDKWQQTPQVDWAAGQLPQFQNPTFGETYNQNNVPSYAAPGAGQQFWDSIMGSFNTAGQYNGPNQSNAAYNQSVQNNPGSLSGDFNTAYDRATKEAIGAADQSAAARGAYGSSSALNNVGNVAADMAANKAKAATEFALQNSAQQNAWQNTINNAAQGADKSSLAGFGAGLAGINTFGNQAFASEDANRQNNKFASDAAFGVGDRAVSRTNTGINDALGIDQSYLGHTTAGFDAASRAEGLRENQTQDAFNNQRGVTKDFMDTLQHIYDGLNDSDKKDFADYWTAMLGGTQNAKNDETNDANDANKSFQDTVGFVKGVGGGGAPSGGAAGGAQSSPLFSDQPSW